MSGTRSSQSGARETDVQAAILHVARLRGWRSYHTFDSRRSAAGFPDLVLVRDRVVFAELKRQGALPRRDQVEWLDALAAAGCEVYLWTLDDLGWVCESLASGWAFVPHGETVRIGGSDLDGPRLVRRTVSVAPPCAWVPGHGRRDRVG